MTTLYRRATPRQALVLKMIEGAARNAANAHPDWSFDPRLAKSIAKRAAGTLTSQWGAVLAVPQAPSEKAREKFSDLPAASDGASPLPSGEGASQSLWRVGDALHAKQRIPIAGLRTVLEAAERDGRAEVTAGELVAPIRQR